MLRPIRKIYQFFVDKPINIGEIVKSRYLILEMIGAGSYGIVYLCKDLATQELKVIKQLRPSKKNNKNEVQLFNNEICIIRSLHHEQMPKLFEDFSECGQQFYVMSYIDGVNLNEAIFAKRIEFNEAEALIFIAKLIKLVDYLHRKDIYHLDLRIPNILLKNNEPYLIDFGLAKKVKTVQLQNQWEEWKHQDYYDLGDILLYLLYTTYPSKSKKALPWTEELSLKKETVILLKKLLRIEKPYENIEEILHDLTTAIKANRED